MTEKSEMTEKEIQTKILELEEKMGECYDRDGPIFFSSETGIKLFMEIRSLKSEIEELA